MRYGRHDAGPWSANFARVIAAVFQWQICNVNAALYSTRAASGMLQSPAACAKNNSGYGRVRNTDWWQVEMIANWRNAQWLHQMRLLRHVLPQLCAYVCVYETIFITCSAPSCRKKLKTKSIWKILKCKSVVSADETKCIYDDSTRSVTVIISLSIRWRL